MLGELTKEQSEQLLRSEMIGRLGCYSNGQVYVVPVTYAYVGGFIYAHSGEGRKVQMMRDNPDVCFEVDHIDNLSNWRSVIVNGRYEELVGDEASRAMEQLMERFLPYMGTASDTMAKPASPAPESAQAIKSGNHQAVVYRIRVNELAGRFETR